MDLISFVLLLKNQKERFIEMTLCACGCGEKVAIAKKTNTTWGHIKGQPVKFVRGHSQKLTRNKLIPNLCACGCGQVTKVRRGHYNEYINGHHKFKNGQTNLNPLDVKKLQNKYNKIAALTNSPFLGEQESAKRKLMEFKLLIDYAEKSKKNLDDTDPETVDKMLKDLWNYRNQPHVVPIPKKEQIKMLESHKMFAEYVPTNPPCPSCPSFDGFPELKKSTGISWHCWRCGGKFAKGSDGKFRKIIKGVVPPPEGEGENPGDYQTHAGQRILGKSGPPGIPTQPTKPTTKPGQPIPKPLPGQGPLRGRVGGGSNQPKGTPGKPRVVP